MSYYNSMSSRQPARPRIARHLRLVALLATAALVLTGCGGPPGAGKAADKKSKTTTTFAADSTMGVIKRRGTMVVGVNWNQAPFAYLNDSTGSPSGLDVDLVKQIAISLFDTETIEGKITWVPLKPREFDLALAQNKVDMVVGRYQITVARKNFIDFAGPYFADPQGIVISTTKRDGAKAPADLNGKKVCVVNGTTDVAAFKALAPGADVTTVRGNMNECGAELITGTVQAIAGRYIDEQQLVKNASTLTLLDSRYSPSLYGVGIKKGVTDLRTFVNDQISTFEYDESYAAWIPGRKVDQPTLDRY